MAAELEILFLRHRLKQRLAVVKNYETQLDQNALGREEILRKALETERLHVRILRRLILTHDAKQKRLQDKLKHIKKSARDLERLVL